VQEDLFRKAAVVAVEFLLDKGVAVQEEGSSPKAGSNGGATGVREERVPRERNRRFGSLGLQRLHQDGIFVES